MSAKQQEEKLSFWQRYRFYFIGFIGAFLLIGSMSVQNVILSYEVTDGTKYAAKLDYSAYGICLRCYGSTKNANDIVEKEIFFLKTKKESVANAASALKDIAEEDGKFQVRVGGLLGNNKKNTAEMVEYLESLGYKATPIE